MAVRDTDYGYKGLINRVFGTEKTPTIKIGVHAKDGADDYGDGVTVLEVAIWNEFGTDNVPERSFIRAWFDENREKCRRAMAKMLEAVIAGKYTKEQAVELVAQRFVGEIQRRMAAGIAPPLAPETIRRKGSDKPLIDTGQLRSSISYSINGKVAESKAEKARRKGREKDSKRRSRERSRERRATLRAAQRGGKRVLRSLVRSARGAVKRAGRILRGKRRRS